ncbi:MAG: hypothetical protein LBN97_03180 [Oscillospiraceae bacterium]|jgi:hypothetical protein|nr:hypothetical protein [Oscillospiraceae bacterium]
MPYTIKYKPTETTVGEFYSIAKTLESYAGRLDAVKNNVGTFSGLGNYKSGIASRSSSVYNVAKAVVVYGEALDEARISYLIAEQKAYQLLSGDTSFNVGDGVRAVTAPTIGGSSTSWWDKMIGGIRDAISGIRAVGNGAVSAIGGTITSWFDKLRELWERAFSPKPVTVPAPEPTPTPAPQPTPAPVETPVVETPPAQTGNTLNYGDISYDTLPNLNPEYFLNQKDFRQYEVDNGIGDTDDNEGCTVTAESIAYSIYHNEKVTPNDYNGWTDGYGASWPKSDAIHGYGEFVSPSTVMNDAYNNLQNGIPTLVRTGYNAHSVVVVGIRPGADPGNLQQSDFLIIDPWDGKPKLLSEASQGVGLTTSGINSNFIRTPK